MMGVSESGVVFYVTICAAAAGMFGLGAGLLGSRMISLAERASTLARERVDLAFEIGETFGDSWRDRHRLSELAVINHLATQARRLTTASLAGTGAVILVSLLVVAGLVRDVAWLRLLLIAAIVVAGGVWVWILDDIAARVARFTTPYVVERARRRKAQGHGVFGAHFDSEDLEEAMDRLLAPLSAGSWFRRLRAGVARWYRRRGPVDTP